MMDRVTISRVVQVRKGLLENWPIMILDLQVHIVLGYTPGGYQRAYFLTREHFDDRLMISS